MADLQLLAKQLEKEFGIKCIQIHIHRDEGFNKTNPDPSNLNLHAHFVADWTHDNGTSLRLGRQAFRTYSKTKKRKELSSFSL